MPPPRTQEAKRNRARSASNHQMQRREARRLSEWRVPQETRLSHGGGTFTEAIPAARAA